MHCQCSLSAEIWQPTLARTLECDSRLYCTAAAARIDSDLSPVRDVMAITFRRLSQLLDFDQHSVAK